MGNADTVNTYKNANVTKVLLINLKPWSNYAIKYLYVI